ncbi:hypothetical protein PUN28_011639 [Cardiocondyla obscurior]|uniref:Uncharacterized protein n=1 Tax=Cardiocondyla obscurior TaxID=286306 RepID=A0AAW2FK12_9HYME
MGRQQRKSLAHISRSKWSTDTITIFLGKCVPLVPVITAIHYNRTMLLHHERYIFIINAQNKCETRRNSLEMYFVPPYNHFVYSATRNKVALTPEKSSTSGRAAENASRMAAALRSMAKLSRPCPFARLAAVRERR